MDSFIEWFTPIYIKSQAIHLMIGLCLLPIAIPVLYFKFKRDRAQWKEWDEWSAKNKAERDSGKK